MTGLKDIRQPPKDDEPGPAARAAEDVMRRVVRESMKLWTPPAPLPPSPALADAIGQAIARHESASVAELRRELADLKARLSAAEPGQASAPKRQTTKERAEWVTRILEALREIDPTLDPLAMPGRKTDFLDLCQKMAPRWFSITPEVFEKTALKGRARFLSGARETTYYRDRLGEVRRKLG